MIFSVLGGVFKFLIGSRIGLTAITLLGLWIAWKANNYHHQKKGAAKVIEKSIEAGRKINRANAKVRKDAQRPGAAGRLLRDYCRDCN